MNNIRLTKMSPIDFKEYYEDKLVRFAMVLEENVHEVGEMGENRAKNQLASLLPDGVLTKDHHFYNILLNDNVIGYLWIKLDIQKQSAFLYEIYIFEEYRSNGYGKKVMSIVERMLIQQSIIYFKLHVFGSNTRAIELYHNIGFKTFGINMVKEFK